MLQLFSHTIVNLAELSGFYVHYTLVCTWLRRGAPPALHSRCDCPRAPLKRSPSFYTKGTQISLLTISSHGFMMSHKLEGQSGSSSDVTDFHPVPWRPWRWTPPQERRSAQWAPGRNECAVFQASHCVSNNPHLGARGNGITGQPHVYYI